MEKDKGMTLTQMQERHLMPNSELFRYMQLRHFVMQQANTNLSIQRTKFEEICLSNPFAKGQITVFYQAIIPPLLDQDKVYIRWWVVYLGQPQNPSTW
ncbi:hypothetical protein FKM82_006559 [Ascaphus truei]